MVYYIAMQCFMSFPFRLLCDCALDVIQCKIQKIARLMLTNKNTGSMNLATNQVKNIDQRFWHDQYFICWFEKNTNDK